MRGDDLNVIEIDGASNNSVDQARQLIANAGLSPTGHARYKVYIIDEVHMLTKEAFNALLKTMEEPPSHVKFILCTTEPHKVPATIQSRCQRFDFRAIPTRQIAEHLTNVLAGEQVQADAEVVWQLAQLGNGSMRDALSLMDRLIAGGKSPLTVQDLEETFGIPDQALVASLVDALAEGDVAESLRRTDALVQRGIAQDQLLEALIARLRHLMLLRACGDDTELVELSDEARAEAAKQAKRFDVAGLTYMIALCEGVERNGKFSSTPRALLDAAIARLALAEKMADVGALLEGKAAPAPGKKKRKAEVGRPAPEPRGGPVAAAPPVAPASTPSTPSVDVSDAQAVWAELVRRVSPRTGYSWLNYLMLHALDEHRAVVAPSAEGRNVIGFATPQRLEPIGKELSEMIGRRVTLTLDVNAGTSSATPNMPASSEAGTSRPVTLSDDQKVAAMSLPLVKRVMETFPEATVMSVEQGDEPTNADTKEKS